MSGESGRDSPIPPAAPSNGDDRNTHTLNQMATSAVKSKSEIDVAAGSSSSVAGSHNVAIDDADARGAMMDESMAMAASPPKRGEGTDAANVIVAGSNEQSAQARRISGSVEASGVDAPSQAQVGGVPVPGALHPQNPYAMMFHPMFSQFAMLHPHFQQMTPQQQQILLLQQHIMMQQMAQESLQQQALQQAQLQSASNPFQNQSTNVAATNGPQNHGIASQNPEANQIAQRLAQQSMMQQQLFQQSFQQQLLQQSQYQAAAAGAAAANAVAAGAAAAAASAVADGATASPAASGSQPPQSTQSTQASGQALNMPFFQVPPMHPLYCTPQGIEAIYQADESNYQAHDSDDEDEDEYDGPSRRLLRLVEDHRWVAALQRITTHPRETQQVGIQGRTPLHVACDHDAPAPLVQALLSAWPEGAERVGTSHMNPLHITCSSPHASLDVVRVLLAGCRDPLAITGAKDVDGDTPLHAACRCAAPMDVLVTLLHANPITVTWKDYEGLNPLMRLWVRYFVLVGEQIISNITKPSDLTSDLVEAWQKSLLLLQVMHAMEKRAAKDNGQDSKQHQLAPFCTVHAASSVDCPRCVVRIAKALFPGELLSRDHNNRLPIHIAAAAPVYAVHDLRGEGFTIDDAMFDDPAQRAARSKEKESKYKEPSVIDILLSESPESARERDEHGQLPLHVAVMRGKTWDEGVQALVQAYPDALNTPDNHTNLYPFMLAASVGRGRGDCSTIYALLRSSPELVHMAVTGKPQEDAEKEGQEEMSQKTRAVKTDS